jgi:hypothetical protein
MNEEEVVTALTALPGVAAMTATKKSGAPEVAWGDSFFYYEPEGVPGDRRFPFATVVIKNYPGFDTTSQLDRPGVFRLNLSVGRARFEDLFGFGPAEFDKHAETFDFAALDRVIPHPVYAKQGWVSVVVPGERSREQVVDLIAYAYERAKSRHRRPRNS